MLLLLTCRACYEKGTVAGLACDKSVDPPIGVGKFARARVAAPEGAGPATSAHLVWLRRSAPEIPVRVTVPGEGYGETLHRVGRGREPRLQKPIWPPVSSRRDSAPSPR